MKLAALTTVFAFKSVSAAFGGCWNAADSAVVGPEVEICIDGSCTRTTLTFECADASGLKAGYANGLSVQINTMTQPFSTLLALNGQQLSAAQIEGASCLNIDGGDGCKFGVQSASEAPSDPDTDLNAVKARFSQLLGVDAEGFQSALIEAGLLTGVADGVWGSSTEVAVRQALFIARERGIPVDLSTDDGLFRFIYAVKDANADPNSGLARSPFAGAHLLVVASRQTYEEAMPIASQLEGTLARAGFSNRTSLVESLNGWVAITVGMYPKEGCLAASESLKSQGLVPSDAYCAPVEKFDPMSWTN